MERITLFHKSWLEDIKRVIADEALPMEIKKRLCSSLCSDDCEHKNYLEVWTWIPERAAELKKIIEKIPSF